MAEIDYRSDKTRAHEKAEGSDGRLNTSSRSDSRAYYNSRDESRTFSTVFDFQDAAAGEFAAYWQNTSTDRILVIDSVGINAAQNARVKLWFVTGTAAGGNTIVPTNLNKSGVANEAEATCMEGGSAATGITGLTEDGIIDFAYVSADGHEEFRLGDRVRLGQGDAIAIEYDEGTGGDFSGVIFGFYEVK